MFMNGFIKKPLIGFGHETREMFRINETFNETINGH